MQKTSMVAEELVAVVDRTAAWLETVDEAAARAKPDPAKWSAQEIVGHLVDSAANNHQRFVRGQEGDVLVSPRYEQDHWVRVQGYSESPWTELVDLWRLYNRHLARVIARIPEDRLDVECRIGSLEPATLGFIVEDYLVHLEHHLAQVEERLRVAG